MGGGGPSVVAATSARIDEMAAGGAGAAGATTASARARIDRAPHRRDVLGRRPAAPADDRRPRVEHVADHPPEVVGAGRVDELALDPLGQAGVRAGWPGPAGAHRRERIQAAHRPGAAVDPDDVDVGDAGQRRRRDPGRRPVRQREVLAERQQRDDRQVGGSGPRLLDRDRQVVDERERLEPEQVGAAFEQPVDGLAEAAPDRPLVEVQDLARRRAERPDGPGHEHVPAGHVARLARDLGATPREPARLVAQAVRARAGCGSPRRSRSR